MGLITDWTTDSEPAMIGDGRLYYNSIIKKNEDGDKSSRMIW